MKNTSITTKAYETLSTYVRKRSYNSRFDTNLLRSKLKQVNGLKSKQIGGVIGSAVRRGLITKIGETTSSNPLHNSGKVGVYTRGWS